MRANTETRRRHLRSLIERGQAHTQEEMREALADEGFVVTQATVSRDLDAIGAIRVKDDGSAVYRLGSGPTTAERTALHAAMDEFVGSATASSNQLVLKVPPGAAQFVASRIDAAGIDGVLGSIAGDDTILVITDEAVDTSEVLRRMEGTD